MVHQTRLTDNQRDVLSCVQLDARRDIESIAKQAGVKAHTAQRALRCLIDQQILSPHTFINVYPLGLRDHAIYFSLCSCADTARDAVLANCLRSPIVCWLAELGGDFQYAIACRTKDILDVHTFIDGLTEKHGSIFADRAIATRIHAVEFGVRCLSSKRGPTQSIHFGSGLSPTSIDALDHEILKALSDMPGVSYAKIARALGCPAATITYRIKILERTGVIAGYHYLLDYDRLGLERYRIMVSMKGSGERHSAKVRECCESLDAVCLYIQCIGNWDFEIEAAVVNPGEMPDLLNQLASRLGSELNRTRVARIFKEPKYRSYPFLSLPE